MLYMESVGVISLHLQACVISVNRHANRDAVVVSEVSCGDYRFFDVHSSHQLCSRTVFPAVNSELWWCEVSFRVNK